MNSLKTSGKLVLLAVAASVLLALIGGIGIFSMRGMAGSVLNDLNAAKTESSTLVSIENAGGHFKKQVQAWKDILIRGNDASSYDKYFAEFGSEEKKVQDSLASASALMKESGIATDDVEKLKRDHLELGDKYREALKQFDRADSNAGKTVDKLVKGIDRATTAGVEKIVTDIEMRMTERMSTQIDRSQASYETARNILAILTLIGLAIAIAVSVAILRDIIGQLGGEPAYAADITRRIAAGDLTVSIETRPGDNSSLLAAMKQMRDALHDVLAQIRQASDKVAVDAAMMSAASNQVSAGSSLQSEATASMAAAVEEMTVSISHVASSAGDARRMAAEAGTLSTEGEGVVKGAVIEINKIANAFNHSSDLISKLGEQSNQISAIVNVIKEIADQTNLLALNAAIEAARAGEQGRGFAVVADEVRKLAERTTTSTQEIAGMIQVIQSGTQSAMQGMTEGGAQVGEGVRMAAKAGDSISKIEASSQKVLDAVAEISSALEEQSSASSLIAQNVEKIAHMTEENSAAVVEVHHAAESLERLSGDLKALIGKFKV